MPQKFQKCRCGVEGKRNSRIIGGGQIYKVRVSSPCGEAHASYLEQISVAGQNMEKVPKGRRLSCVA